MLGDHRGSLSSSLLKELADASASLVADGVLQDDLAVLFRRLQSGAQRFFRHAEELVQSAMPTHGASVRSDMDVGSSADAFAAVLERSVWNIQQTAAAVQTPLRNVVYAVRSLRRIDAEFAEDQATLGNHVALRITQVDYHILPAGHPLAAQLYQANVALMRAVNQVKDISMRRRQQHDDERAAAIEVLTRETEALGEAVSAYFASVEKGALDQNRREALQALLDGLSSP